MKQKNGTIDAVDSPGTFRVPGAQEVPRHSTTRKNNERENGIARKNGKNAILANSRIGQSNWRGSSKTCDCIDKGKISPVLRLVDQARAVSSPDPLHRPDNPRASMLTATTAQTLR